MRDVKTAIDKFIGKTLVVLETLIAIISMVVVVGLLCVQLVTMFTNPSFFTAEDAVTTYLHEILNVVIALEFTKLLLHLTPANILEVLTMAIARGIIVNHGTAIDNLLSIACIVGMFAARRYLIPRNELHRDLDDTSPEPQHSRKSRRSRHGKQEETTSEKQEVPQT